jgi:hypothetical protein
MGGAAVAWAVTQTYDVSWNDYQRVVQTVGEKDLPDGLYFHVAGPEADGIRVMSLWDSEDSFNAFVEQRFAPAAVGLLGEEMVAQDPTSHVPLDVQHFLLAHAITPASHQIAFY